MRFLRWLPLLLLLLLPRTRLLTDPATPRRQGGVWGGFWGGAGQASICCHAFSACTGKLSGSCSQVAGCRPHLQ